MERSGHNQVAMFVGKELENSKMKGSQTLFVVGDEPVSEIISNASSHDILHIYMCANKSFTPGMMGYYFDTVAKLIKEKYFVTFDFPCYYFAMVQNVFKDYLTSEYFIPMVNVELPNLESMPNLAIRLDDIDFNKTNSGVWVLNRDTFNNSQCYTSWSEYSTDKIVKHKAA